MKSKKGFTIIEILVVVAILAIVMTVIATFSSNITVFNRFSSSQFSAQQDAKKIVDKFVAELRGVSPSSTGTYPIEQATGTNLVFYANIDSDTYIERIHYFVSGNRLMRGMLKPSGNPLTYVAANEASSTIVANLSTATTTVFYYYDGTATATSSPMSLPVSINRIRMIKIDLWIDEDENRPPAAMEIFSKVNLRNLKDN